jgi:hypothetical protein
LGGVKVIENILPAAAKLPGGLIGTPMTFDFNNDGNGDLIFLYEGSGKFIKGSILYVILNAEKKNLDPQRTIQLSDIRVYPCQFNKAKRSAEECPPLSRDNDESNIHVNIGEGMIFRGRYTALTPVFFKGETYFLLRGQSYGTDDYAAAIKVDKENKFSSVCLFKKPQIDK